LTACYQAMDAMENLTATKSKDFDIAAEIEKVKSSMVTIDRKGALVTQYMDIPIAMAEHFGGTKIQIHSGELNWSAIVLDSWETARNWAIEISEYGDAHIRSSYGVFELEVNEALSRMKGIGDDAKVRMAITNLLKNAIKFSLPPGNGRPTVIRVFANPQKGWNNIIVKNWGIGIPEQMGEQIFLRYVRFERTDRFRAIPGRGLGLYIARKLMRAQGGNVYLKSSTAKFDDPDRSHNFEGYETTFELRLPTQSSVQGGNKWVTF
jgi:signal transduction histidine kinase